MIQRQYYPSNITLQAVDVVTYQYLGRFRVLREAMGAAVFGLYAVAFGALSIHHVSYAVVGLICMFAFEQWGAIYLPFVAANGTLVNIVILAFVAIAWFRLPAGTSLEFVKYPTRTLLILFLGYAFVTTLWSPPDANATGRFLDEIHYLLAALVVAPLLMRTTVDFSRVLDAVTWLGGSLVVLFAYVPDFEGRSLSMEYGLEETLGLPLALGDFGGLVFLVTAFRMRASLISIVWAAIVCGSALYLITQTGSRGQLFFAIGSLIICLPVRWKGFSVNRVMALMLVVLIAIAAVYIVVNTENTLSGRMLNTEDSTGAMARVELVTVLMDAWIADPSAMLFGLGSSASWSRSVLSGYSHVVPLEILGELGLVGFVFFSISVLTLFLQAFTGNHRKQLDQRALSNFAALFACWVFSLLLSCKQGTLLFSTGIFLYAALAEKCLHLNSAKMNRKSRQPRPAKLRKQQAAR